MTGAPPVLVTGSGRSGTGHLVRVLRSAGIKAGHEEWWTLSRKQTPGLDVDVSWLGCFDMTYRGRVLAQVRDPRACVPSIWANEQTEPWYLLRRLTCHLTGDWRVDAAIIWHAYTSTAVARAAAWWRVEDLTAELVREHFGAAPRAMPPNRGVNHRRDTSGYEWPDHPITDRCAALARSLGYEVDWC